MFFKHWTVVCCPISSVESFISIGFVCFSSLYAGSWISFFSLWSQCSVAAWGTLYWQVMAWLQLWVAHCTVSHFGSIFLQNSLLKYSSFLLCTFMKSKNPFIVFSDNKCNFCSNWIRAMFGLWYNGFTGRQNKFDSFIVNN